MRGGKLCPNYLSFPSQEWQDASGQGCPFTPVSQAPFCAGSILPSACLSVRAHLNSPNVSPVVPAAFSHAVQCCQVQQFASCLELSCWAQEPIKAPRCGCRSWALSAAWKCRGSPDPAACSPVSQGREALPLILRFWSSTDKNKQKKRVDVVNLSSQWAPTPLSLAERQKNKSIYVCIFLTIFLFFSSAAPLPQTSATPTTWGWLLSLSSPLQPASLSRSLHQTSHLLSGATSSSPRRRPP